MAVETAAETDTGRTRDHNEDSVLVAPTSAGRVLAVADGMGGHNAGEVASATALDAFVDELRDGLDGPTAEALTAAVEAADDAVRAAAADDPDRDGMGTTLVAALVHDDSASVVNLGDSRAYRVGDDHIEQVTVDHSLVQDLVDSGEISEAEAEVHPKRNVLAQALGARDSIDPDSFSVDLQADDRLLLCSDGLTEEVPESAMQSIVADAPSLDAAADRLVDRANENGGSDNISAVLGRPHWPG